MKKDEDFYGWSLEVAEEFKSDRPELAEFMESMGRSQLRELGSRFTILIMHLLKWEYQPNRRSRSWLTTIKIQRYEIQELLKESPSLNSKLKETVSKVYALSVSAAVDETGLSFKSFPKEIPYSVDELLNKELGKSDE